MFTYKFVSFLNSLTAEGNSANRLFFNILQKYVLNDQWYISFQVTYNFVRCGNVFKSETAISWILFPVKSLKEINIRLKSFYTPTHESTILHQKLNNPMYLGWNKCIFVDLRHNNHTSCCWIYLVWLKEMFIVMFGI